MFPFAVSIVIGIPTVKRDSVSYVAQTIDSLIAGMTREEQDDCLIVLFVAEVIGQLQMKTALVHICHCQSIQLSLILIVAFWFCACEMPQSKWTLNALVTDLAV